MVHFGLVLQSTRFQQSQKMSTQVYYESSLKCVYKIFYISIGHTICKTMVVIQQFRRCRGRYFYPISIKIGKQKDIIKLYYFKILKRKNNFSSNFIDPKKVIISIPQLCIVVVLISCVIKDNLFIYMYFQTKSEINWLYFDF